MPIIPYITINYHNIDSLYAHAKECDVHYVLPGTLYLRGYTRKTFFDFIQKQYPHLSNKLLALYEKGGANKEYKNDL